LILSPAARRLIVLNGGDCATNNLAAFGGATGAVHGSSLNHSVSVGTSHVMS